MELTFAMTDYMKRGLRGYPVKGILDLPVLVKTNLSSATLRVRARQTGAGFTAFVTVKGVDHDLTPDQCELIHFSGKRSFNLRQMSDNLHKLGEQVLFDNRVF